MKTGKVKIRHAKNLLFAAAVSVILWFSVVLYVGQSLGGNWDWLTLSANVFGVPEELQEELQMEPLFEIGKNHVGWDGQFYYYISNDLLGLKDTSEHIDSPSYRYQRVGLPLLAKTVSLVFLRKVVTVPVYVLTNIVLLGIAVYFMSVYLNERGKSGLWVLTWLFATGTLITMRHLLPDSAADALILTAVIMLVNKKYNWYSILMTLGCLTREAFILIAFLLFCMQLFRELKEKTFSLRRLDYKLLFKFAFPGIIFIAWYAYVTIHFGAMPMSQAGQVQGWYMQSWAVYLKKAWESGSWWEFCSLSLYGVTVVYMLLYAVILGRKNHLYWVFVPYIILVSSFGPTVMGHWSGYLKGISFLFGLLPLMLAEPSRYAPGEKVSGICIANKIVIFLIAVSCICLGVTEYAKFQKGVLILRYTDRAGVSETAVEPLKEFDCELELVSVEEKKLAKNRFMKYFTKDYEIYTVRVKNTSGEYWTKDKNADGSQVICLSCQWYKKKKPKEIIMTGNPTNLPQDVAPGEEIFMDLYVEKPRNVKGKYVLRISLLQRENTWFYQKPEAQCIKIPFEFGKQTVTGT